MSIIFQHNTNRDKPQSIIYLSMCFSIIVADRIELPQVHQEQRKKGGVIHPNEFHTCQELNTVNYLFFGILLLLCRLRHAYIKSCRINFRNTFLYFLYILFCIPYHVNKHGFNTMLFHVVSVCHNLNPFQIVKRAVYNHPKILYPARYALSITAI